MTFPNPYSRHRAGPGRLWVSRFAAVLLPLPLVLFLSSCIPLLTTTQPAASIVVTDEGGVPIEGATLNFATTVYGARTTTDFVAVETDQSGAVRLDRESVLQLALLAVDGVAVYGWSYCIEKAGFRPVSRNRLSKKHFRQAPIVEVLTRPDSVSTCNWSAKTTEYVSIAPSAH